MRPNCKVGQVCIVHPRLAHCTGALTHKNSREPTKNLAILCRRSATATLRLHHLLAGCTMEGTNAAIVALRPHLLMSPSPSDLLMLHHGESATIVVQHTGD